MLERLHSLYSKKFAKSSINHCATLLINYRCHHALLSLPSYLFYDSALVTAAESAADLHPYTKYPLHFVCSSLSEDSVVSDTTNRYEVKLLLEEVAKYFRKCPFYMEEVCIMTATSYQVSNSFLDLMIMNYSEKNCF